VSGDACVTAADVAAEQSVAAAAEGRGELTGLALWLLAERQKVGWLSGVMHTLSGVQNRYWCILIHMQHLQAAITTKQLVAQGSTSAWAPFLEVLPERVDTPLVWDDAQRELLLRGSPVAEASAARSASIRAEWGAISAAAPDLPPGERWRASAVAYW
jgi:protein-histidine N-methyltransferase